MKICVIGDVHGETGKLNNFIQKNNPDLIISTGDFGYWPNWGYDFSKIKNPHTQIFWCDGNHEDHWAIKRLLEKSNGKPFELYHNIWYMPRGSTYTLLDGRVILFMGGALSIDKESRTLGTSWFPEETITQRDIENLPDCKIDIVISHTCPEELLPEMLKVDERKINDPSNLGLSYILHKYQPNLWYFGHWHKFKQGVIIIEGKNVSGHA